MFHVLVASCLLLLLGAEATKPSRGFKILRDDPIDQIRLAAEVRKILARSHQGIGVTTSPLSFENGLPAKLREDIDQFVSDLQQCSEIPGLVFALTSNRTTLHTSSSGSTHPGYPDDKPITDQTLFGIGSTTKAFTTTGLSILLDRGLLDWDDHDLLAKNMPRLHINMTSWDWDLTLRDLASHRTGIGRNDDIWLSFPDFTREHVVDYVVPFLLPVGKFRYQFVYSNWMYTAAGTYIDSVTSQSWEDFIQLEILKKLGMNRSQTRVLNAIQDSNYAVPHMHINGKPAALPIDINTCVTPLAPAGAISSCALDMTNWIRLHLNMGFSPDTNQQIVSSKSLAETHTPTMSVGVGFGPDYHLPNEFGVDDVTNDYALGWITSSYRGYRSVWHDGGTVGHTTKVALLPELPNGDGIGMFASINQFAGQENLALELLSMFVFDTILGVSPPAIDSTRACQIMQAALHPSKSEEADTAQQSPKRKAPVPQPQSALQPAVADIDYSGTYTNQAWGELTVFQNNTILLNLMTANLVQGAGDHTFEVHCTGIWGMLTGGGPFFNLAFDVDGSGSVHGVSSVTPDGSYYFSRPSTDKLS